MALRPIRLDPHRDLVVLRGGPMNGQWFYADEFAARQRATMATLNEHSPAAAGHVPALPAHRPARAPPQRARRRRDLHLPREAVMPCKTGMTGCKRSCLHRANVGDYRLAREAAVAKRDAETLGYATELAAYPPIITFKKWLIDGARPAYEQEEVA